MLEALSNPLANHSQKWELRNLTQPIDHDHIHVIEFMFQQRIV